jgi:translation elongation factor EF-G
MVNTNFSQQTANQIIEQYEFRVTALINKIDRLESKLRFTEAKLEVAKEYNKL